MYKVDIKTLNEITKNLDSLVFADVSGNNFQSFTKALKKAKSLSAKIKNNYTEIKP